MDAPMTRMTYEDHKIAIDEILESPDRSAAIVAAAIVETILEEGIIDRLLPMSNTHRDSLFGGEASFATFSAKINLGLSLGLYGIGTKSDLNLIRKIRNEFAHHANRSFAHPEISKHCALITNYRTEPEPDPLTPEVAAFYTKFPRIDLRWRFLYATSAIGRGILQETSSNGRVPPNPTILA
jgi:hypothetical protein